MKNDATQTAARSKADWLEEIERCLESGDYNQAKSLTQGALSKFPDDPEILALEENAIRGRENHALAFQLMQEGHQICEEQNFREGLPVLRDAYAMDERSAVIRAELVNALVSFAQATVSTDPQAAEALAREAMDLDPESTAAKNLHQSIQGRKSAGAVPPNAPVPEKPRATPETKVPLSAGQSPAPSAAPRPAVATAPSVALPNAAVPRLAFQGGGPAMPAATSPKPPVQPPPATTSKVAVPPGAAAPGMMPGRPVAPAAKPAAPPLAPVAPPGTAAPATANPGSVTSVPAGTVPKPPVQPPAATAVLPRAVATGPIPGPAVAPVVKSPAQRPPSAAPPRAVVPPAADLGGVSAKPAPAVPKPAIPPPAATAPRVAAPPGAAAPGTIPGRQAAPAAQPSVPAAARLTPPGAVAPQAEASGSVLAEPHAPAPVTPVAPPWEIAAPAAAVSSAAPAGMTRPSPLQPTGPASGVGHVQGKAPHLSDALQPKVAAAAARKVSVPVWMLVAGAVAILIIAAVLMRSSKHSAPVITPIQVEIQTSPSGAQVRINGEPRNIAGPLPLAPGNYRIEALLDGYQTTVQDVSVSAQSHGPFVLTLLPAQPGLRVSTDLEAGKVVMDGQPIGELQDGQFVLDDLKPGKHTLQITSGRSAEASIPFEAPASGPPVLDGAISAKNLRVIVLSNVQALGHVYCNFGPVPLTLDGQPSGDVPQAGGLDLNGLNAAAHELVFGKGKDQHKLAVDVNSAGGLLVSLSSDRNIGNLEILANVPDFEVLVNGKPHKIVKQKGHYYLYNLEASTTTIQIAKNGFQTDPLQQKVEVLKGEMVRVPFKLTPIPTTATVHIQGLLPGTRVTLDSTTYSPQADGSVTATLKEGDHVVELKRPGFKPKTVRLPIKAGQTINLSGRDAMLEDPVTGRLVIASRNPAGAKVVLRRRDGMESPVGEQAEEPEGDYTLIATAPGYKDLTLPVHIAEAAPASVDVKLVHILVKMHMEGFENPGSWKQQEGWYTRKGGNFALFNASSSAGAYQFTAKPGSRQFPIFHGGHIQWVINYVDAWNYELYEMDKDKLTWRRVTDGKPGSEKKELHRVAIKDETYRLSIDTGPGQVVQKVFDGQTWQPLPSLSEGTANSSGKFGFFLPGGDEIRISDFEFTPKE